MKQKSENWSKKSWKKKGVLQNAMAEAASA
jgi:hypothetical protein